jgi:hypothetical protein
VNVDRGLVLGYLLALAIPPVGLVFGLVMTARPGPLGRRQGVGILAVSLLALVVWFLVLRSGAVTSSSTNY